MHRQQLQTVVYKALQRDGELRKAHSDANTKMRLRAQCQPAAFPSFDKHEASSGTF